MTFPSHETISPNHARIFCRDDSASGPKIHLRWFDKGKMVSCLKLVCHSLFFAISIVLSHKRGGSNQHGDIIDTTTFYTKKKHRKLKSKRHHQFLTIDVSPISVRLKKKSATKFPRWNSTRPGRWYDRPRIPRAHSASSRTETRRSS